MTDEVDILAVTLGDLLEGPLGTRTSLTFYCAPKMSSYDLTVRVSIGRAIDRHLNFMNEWASYVTTRFDQEDSAPHEFQSSSDGFWIHNEFLSIWRNDQWAHRMLAAERLLISVRPLSGDRVITEFDLRDMDKEIAPVLEECPLEPPAS
jgi:hypothetical protein